MFPVILVHPAKASSPMYFKFNGAVPEVLNVPVNPVHPLNACTPTVSRNSGKFNSPLRLVHPAKASSSIKVTFLGKLVIAA